VDIVSPAELSVPEFISVTEVGQSDNHRPAFIMISIDQDGMMIDYESAGRVFESPWARSLFFPDFIVFPIGPINLNLPSLRTTGDVF
jgi:hypothetical protein